MRKLILLCFVLVGCIPYKDYLANDDLCNFDAPIFKLKEEEKLFDIIKYKSVINDALMTRKRPVIKNDSVLMSSIYVFPNKAISKTPPLFL